MNNETLEQDHKRRREVNQDITALLGNLTNKDVNTEAIKLIGVNTDFLGQVYLNNKK